MTAKEYLQRAMDIERQIDADILEAYKLRSLAEKCTTVFPTDRVKGGAQSNRLENAAIKLAELEDRIIEDVERLVKVKDETRQLIEQLEKPEERMVLQLRYLCGKRWVDIAHDMSYEWAQTHRIHARALRSAEKMI